MLSRRWLLSGTALLMAQRAFAGPRRLREAALFGTGVIAPTYLADFTLGKLPSGVTVSSPSTGGLVTDSTGKLTYKPNNLLLNSATLSTQSITTTIGVNYIISFYGTGTVTLSGAATNVIVGTGVGNQVYANITATTTSLTLTVVGSVTSAVTAAVTYETSPRPGDQVITTSSAYYGPAFDYDPVTLQPLGLRIWESRTNLLGYSQSIAAGVSAAYYGNPGGTNFVLTDGQSGFVDGTASFTEASETGATSTFRIYRLNALTASGTYTQSVFVTPGTSPWLNIHFALSGADYYQATFNTSTAVPAFSQYLNLGSSFSSPSYTIANVGNGVYRLTFTVTFTYVATNAYTGFGLQNLATNAFFTTYTGASRYTFVGGYQCEAGSFAGPYIPTRSAAVTAAADVVSLGGVPLGVLQGSAGTAVIEAMPMTSFTNPVLIGGTGTSSPHSIPIYLHNSGPWPVSTYNGSTVKDGPLIASIAGQTIRGGVAWNASGRSVVGNGATPASDANAANFGAVNAALGADYWINGATPVYLNGYIRKLSLWNSRLPDATLKAKSVVGAPF